MVRLTIIVGTQFDKFSRPIDFNVSEHLRNELINHACNVFGGITSIASVGSWKNEEGNYISEKGIILTVLADNANNGETFAKYARDLFSQNSVVLTIEKDISVSFV